MLYELAAVASFRFKSLACHAAKHSLAVSAMLSLANFNSSTNSFIFPCKSAGSDRVCTSKRHNYVIKYSK